MPSALSFFLGFLGLRLVVPEERILFFSQPIDLQTRFEHQIEGAQVRL